MFLLSVLFFSNLFPIQFTVVACTFFTPALFYLSNKHQNGTLLKMQ